NTKMIIVFLAILPIFLILYPLVQVNAGIVPILIVIVIYAIGYTYVLRFFVFEEMKLRKMVKDVDDNKISGIEHFWGIDKIGGGEEDDGMNYYSLKDNYSGSARGLLVVMDKGSTVGVPEGHFESYRRTKEQFLR